MALKFKLKSKDEIPAELVNLYVEQETACLPAGLPVGPRPSPQPSDPRRSKPDPILDQFWSPVLPTPSPPLGLSLTTVLASLVSV